MVTYIVFGIFIYNQGYLDYEPSRGVDSKFPLQEIGKDKQIYGKW